MNIFEDLLKNIWFVRGVKSFIIILTSIIVYAVITSTLVKRIESGLSKKKAKTYVRLIKSIIRYIFIIVTVLVILKVFGINVSSMVAGVGIIGIVIGFAIQDALKDIIKGFDIITDSYYQVGDVIKFGNTVGKVLAIGLKTTKLEDIYSLNIVSISNRNIEQVEVVSNLINIDIPIPYEVKVEDAESAINDILNEIKNKKDVDKCEYRGVNDLADSSIKYQIKIYCDPLKKVQIKRDSLRCILKGLEKNNIQVPYNQIDIHQKD